MFSLLHIFLLLVLFLVFVFLHLFFAAGEHVLVQHTMLVLLVIFQLHLTVSSLTIEHVLDLLQGIVEVELGLVLQDWADVYVVQILVFLDSTKPTNDSVHLAQVSSLLGVNLLVIDSRHLLLPTVGIGHQPEELMWEESVGRFLLIFKLNVVL